MKCCEYSPRLHFLHKLQMAKQARVLNITRLARYKHTSLFNTFVSYEKIKCCEYSLRFLWLKYGSVFKTFHFHCNLQMGRIK